MSAPKPPPPEVLAALVAHAQAPLAYVDATLTVVWTNAAYAALVRRAPHELPGLPLAEVAPDPAWAALSRAALDSGQPATRLVHCRGAADGHAGEEAYWRWHVTPHRDPDGRPRGVVLAGRDTTAEVRAQAHAEAEAARLRLVVDAARLATWEWDLDAGTVAWNDTHHQMLGYGPGEVAPSYARWAERVHPDDLSVAERSLEEVLRGGDYRAEYRVVRPDGAVRWVEARGRTLRGGDGEPTRQYGVMLDITERKQTEQALRESDQRKGEFLAVLSHELRNPLAAISGGLAVLARVPHDAPAARRALDVIARQVGHLARLVDDLLDVTRLARDKMRIDRGPVALAELARATAEDHRALFERAGVALEVDVPGAALTVLGDAHRIAQVIGNLLSNAAKFTGRGGRARLVARAEDGAAVLRISDDGPGMTPDVLARAFEPFAQGEATLDRAGGGLGLGLALASGIISRLGGTIDARSAGPGTGAEFAIRLPLASPDPTPTDAVAAAPAAPAARRVLVIEDNADAAELLVTVLTLDGHEVRVAHDGPTGVACARAWHPDVVLCDLGLPGMDGYDVARALRADAALAATCLVALSGYARPQDRARAHAAGFDAHLAKPPELAALAALLRDLSPPPPAPT